MDMEIEDVRCVNNNSNWLLILLGILLLTNFTGDCNTNSGVGFPSNFLGCGSNSWILILVMILAFNGGF